MFCGHISLWNHKPEALYHPNMMFKSFTYLCKDVRIPHMYWSTSRSSRTAVLLKVKKRVSTWPRITLNQEFFILILSRKMMAARLTTVLVTVEQCLKRYHELRWKELSFYQINLSATPTSRVWTRHRVYQLQSVMAECRRQHLFNMVKTIMNINLRWLNTVLLVRRRSCSSLDITLEHL